MPNATITAPTGTQTANFDVAVVFDEAVTGVEKTDFNLRALTGNGVMGVDYTISGTEPTETFTLNFTTLPAAAKGSFEISITGMVTPDGETTPEAVMANTAIVSYDTTTNTGATFGTVEYPEVPPGQYTPDSQEYGLIVIPVTFAEAVLSPDESIINLAQASGDDLDGTESRLVGEDTDYRIIVRPPLNRKGSFTIGVSGQVFLIASQVWDSVTVAPITVDYDNTIPQVEEAYAPARYHQGSRFDAKFYFNLPVQGIHANNAQLALQTTQPFGSALPYKWTGTEPTNQSEIRALLEAEEPEDLSGTDWELLQTPPGGHQGPWYGEEFQILLMRYIQVPAEVDGNVDFIFDGAPEGVGNKGY